MQLDVPRIRRALPAVAAVGLALASAGASLLRVLDLPDTAPDAGQFWLGTHALLRGLDPRSPEVGAQLARELMGAAGGQMPPSPYPVTAYVLFLPAAALSWSTYVRVFRVVNWAALGLSVVLAVLAAAPRSRSAQITLSGVLVAGAYVLRVSTANLRVAQITPLIILACAAALWALRTERTRGLAAIVALGAAIKFVPGLVLVGAVVRRQWAGDGQQKLSQSANGN